MKDVIVVGKGIQVTMLLVGCGCMCRQLSLNLNVPNVAFGAGPAQKEIFFKPSGLTPPNRKMGFYLDSLRCPYIYLDIIQGNPRQTQGYVKGT